MKAGESVTRTTGQMFITIEQREGERAALALVKITRQRQRLARKLVAHNLELSSMSWTWIKDRVNGYRLESDHGHEIAFDRWTHTLPASRWYIDPSEPSPEDIAGAVVRENFAKEGLEITLAHIPTAQTILFLQAHGFRWSRRFFCWWRKYDKDIHDKMAAAFMVAGPNGKGVE